VNAFILLLLQELHKTNLFEYMNEKILALLTNKFSQARKDGLQQLARSLALQVADESQAQALVDTLTVDKVTDFIKEWRREVDAEVSNANKTYESTLRSKYDFVDKKNQPETHKPDNSNQETPEDVAQIIKQSIQAAVQPLQEKLSLLESGKITDSRKQTLERKLKSAPQAFKKTVLGSFGKMKFENDEEFNSFLSETEQNLEAFTQEAANSGLGSFPRPGIPAGTASQEAVTADIKAWAGTRQENH
jgi:hypothetical protein